MNKTTVKTNGQNKPKQYAADLLAVLTGLSPGQLILLYRDLLTEREAFMLAKRLEVAHGLLSGQSYLKIQKQLGVTANTVAQIQKVLKKAGAGFRAAHAFLASLKESEAAAVQQLRVRSLPRPASSSPTAKKKFFETVFGRVFHSSVRQQQ